MKDEIKKKAVPDSAAASSGVGVLIALVVTVGALLGVQLYVQSRAQAPTVTRQQQMLTAPPLAGPSPPPPAAPHGPKTSARDGVIGMGALMRGILLMEMSPHPLTPEQAKDIYARFYQGQPQFGAYSPTMNRAEYLNGLVAQILTTDQKALLDRQNEQNYVTIGPAQGAALESRLQSLSGLPPPGTLMSLPDEKFIKGYDYIEPLIGHFDALQANAATRLTPQQARKLVPIMHTYNAKPMTFSSLVLSYLTDEQKTYIDEHVQEATDGGGHDHLDTAWWGVWGTNWSPTSKSQVAATQKGGDDSSKGLDARFVELLRQRAAP